MAKTNRNVIGLRRHHLTVIKELESYRVQSGPTRRVIIARCDCGNEKKMLLRRFSRVAFSCGCKGATKEIIKKQKTKKKTSSKESVNEWTIEGRIAFIVAKHGKIVVDSDELFRLNNKDIHSRLNGSAYAFVKNDGKWVLLHRFLLSPGKNLEVDHIDGNGLNNRKDNLRICTRAENSRNRRKPKHNRSGYKGVYFDSRRGCWVAQISFNKRQIKLGSFQDAEDAAKSYDAAAKIFFGEFARLNFQ